MLLILPLVLLVLLLEADEEGDADDGSSILLLIFAEEESLPDFDCGPKALCSGTGTTSAIIMVEQQAQQQVVKIWRKCDYEQERKQCCVCEPSQDTPFINPPMKIPARFVPSNYSDE